ncbi:CDP-diacylglycerol--glycerol-3-phosphate 3-phosphatidyltransferase [Planctomyces sp. SH-PL62]|uniref:CDP-diacylglycerol--glycerol-3-phosphate 3-phosphatidyltransferase n=1 Tax=Planctomyces sp. SH-PL62 TaxID=1636152 RepID=UPI00078E5965|nr:CDP-diacylglycerol--glycerol-3-phosphate 3-phosphatidyltransferase [Planctomyces sp. SH-PL62]AMV38318.1 CDP-diacylglycerol--glycerol-3-phosphate 3-phosphatidyltransferase [Planctomyces sp. SH-PL62]
MPPENHSVLDAPARPAGTFWNVPNTLTVSRLGLTVLVCAAMSLEWYGWAFGLFVVAAVSDALDGYFARLLDQDTPLGRQLDPLIDKVIVSSAYIYLAAIPGTGVLPWMVTAIVVRELLIQGLRSLLEGQGQAFGAKMAGKLKTLFQCLSVSAALLCLWLVSPAQELTILRDAFTWIAVALTLYSGASYLWGAGPALRGEAARRR